MLKGGLVRQFIFKTCELIYKMGDVSFSIEE